MANSFVLAETYLPLMDEVYKASSRTAVLDATNIQIVNGNTVKIYKTDMDGLGDYSRSTGFPAGDVSGSWETLTLTQDRGRSFTVDRMDNEETLGMAFGTLVGEFIRTKVAPEVDAYTFAKLASASGINIATAADVTVGDTDVPTLIDEGERVLNEAEVYDEGRLLFISETAYAGLRNKVVKVILNTENGVNKEIDTYDGMQIIRVPQSRFYTEITTKDGVSSGETAGGYSAGGYPINFMIVHPGAVAKCTKHVLPRIFSPDTYQQADAWKFDYRIYFDAFVRENKVGGIYLHRGATAAS